jgi:hypothetical protein
MRLTLVTCHLTALLLAATGCGDDGGSATTCGEGTTLQDGMCIAPPPADCGPGTRLDNGVCVVDQPTTCGVGTVLEGTECVVDRSAPGPVTELAASISGSDIGLSWTAGAMATETLIARLEAGAEDAPAVGVAYTAGQTLPGGATVVAVGAGTTASDPFTVPGRYTYMAWPINASGTYGFGREVSITTAVPAQVATLTVDIAAATATVTSQPPNFQLAVANLVFDEASSSATFELSATNQTAGHYFSAKAVVHSTSVGAVGNATGTAANGDPFVTLGFAAQLPGDARSNTVTLAGVGATDTITLEVEIVESGIAFLASNVADLGGGPAVALDIPATNGLFRDKTQLSGGFLSPSGRYLYGVSRFSNEVFRIDTTSGDARTFSRSSFTVGNGTCLERGADGFAYAVFALGNHRKDGAKAISILKLDPASFTPIASTELVLDGEPRLAGCAVGVTKLAIGADSNLYFADLATMQFIDMDASSPDVIDPLVTEATEDLHGFAFAPNGSTLYVTASKTESVIYAIDTASYAVSTFHTATSPRVMSLTVAANGTLWWAADDGVYAFDGTTETKVPNLAEQMRAIATPIGTKLFAVTENNATFTLDTTDGSTTGVGTMSDLENSGHHVALFAAP